KYCIPFGYPVHKGSITWKGKLFGIYPDLACGAFVLIFAGIGPNEQRQLFFFREIISGRQIQYTREVDTVFAFVILYLFVYIFEWFEWAFDMCDRLLFTCIDVFGVDIWVLAGRLQRNEDVTFMDVYDLGDAFLQIRIRSRV